MLGFRIVQILIDSGDDDDSIPEWARPKLSQLLEYSRRGDNIASVPVATTDARYGETVAILKSAAVKFEEMDISDDYELYVTTAPAAYDYPYHVSIATLTQHGAWHRNDWRLIALQKERAEYQLNRYGSGLFPAHKVG